MNRDLNLGLLACALIASIFVLDLFLELGVATGVLYILPVLISVWMSDRRWILSISLCCGIMVVLGYFGSPNGGEWAKVFFNRLLSILIIGVTAFLVYYLHFNVNNLREAYLREARRERYLNAVLDQLVDAVVVIDSRGIIQSINPSVSKMFQYEEKELLGNNVKMIMPEPFFTEHDQYLDNYFKTGNRQIIGFGRELEGKRKNGTVFPLYLAVSEVETDGEDRHFVGVMRDITEQKTDEARLQEYAAELENSNQALRQFASVASHDLKEPLRKVSYFISLLGDPQSKYSREHCESKISESVSRMGQLLEGMLSLAKTRTKEKFRQVVCLNRVLKEVAETLEIKIQETGAKLKIDNLPEVEADPILLYQLFQNLISNAIKFQAPGSTPEIAVTSNRLNGEWVIEVKDNGIGIPEEFQEKIFKPLERLHGRSAYEGTGLGLAICREIVHAHGGQLKVESQPSAGSIFRFTLPAKPQAVETGSV